MATGPAQRGVLNERAEDLFKLLVHRYIREGRPVGSRTLARDSGRTLSPATIRNVMADLEDLGLLSAPHTSAGRIPTVQGYRLFVDTMLHTQPLANDEVRDLEERVHAADREDTLAETTSALLSEITHLAGIVMLPREEQVILRHVEFLSLSDKRVLVILVINEHAVQNRIIRTKRRYSPAELQEAANYLNDICAGQSLTVIRKRIVDELRRYRESMNRMTAVAVEVAEKAFEAPPASEGDFVVAGQTRLMEYDDLANMDKLRQLFEAFNQKRDILHLLDQCLRTQGVHIFIGEECGYGVLDEFSVVTSPYESGGRVIGVLGVIGPTRMAYERVVPIVDITARLVTAALNREH